MPSRLLPNDHVPSHTPLPPPATLVRQKSSLREPVPNKRASSHLWSELRNGILRKVFGVLVAQIALTAVVSIQMLNAGQARVDEARAAPPELSPIDLCEDFACGKNGRYTRDGECDDGGYGSVSSVCAFGTDCADCGMRP